MNEILSLIDAELSKLQQARAILAGYSDPVELTVKRGPGRPKKDPSSSAKKSAKRVMSEEARSKIAAAQKKRWMAWKKDVR